MNAPTHVLLHKKTFFKFKINIQNSNLQSFIKFEFAKLYTKMQDIQTSTEAHNNSQDKKEKT
jgi:hypothetical protein